MAVTIIAQMLVRIYAVAALVCALAIIFCLTKPSSAVTVDQAFLASVTRVALASAIHICFPHIRILLAVLTVLVRG